MKNRTILMMLTALLALGTAPMLGCNGDDDPSQNNDNNTNNTADTGMEDTGGDDDTGTTDTGTDEDTGTTDTGGDDAGDAGSCTPFADFTGQAFTGGENPDPHNGGNPVEGGTVDFDANLQAVYDAVPLDATDANVEDRSMENTDIFARTPDTPIAVDQALVIGTLGDQDDTPDTIEGNGRLWLQDTNTAIQFFYAFPEGEEPTDTAIKVGDRVSFSVTEVVNYGGTPEITAIESGSFSVDSSGADVPFTDYTGMEIPTDDYAKLVRVAGVITSDNGSCGGSSKCFDLTHGAEGSEVVSKFRVNQAFFLEEGECLTYFGPLGGFPGPVGNDNIEPQLDAVNFDWAFTSQ